MKRCHLITCLAFLLSLSLINIWRAFDDGNNKPEDESQQQQQQPAEEEDSGSSQQKQQPMKEHLSPESSFGACLMMKDDNELLYEWIAYHYTVLPLRYLVVGSDEGSTQNPLDVLQRWDDDDGALSFKYWTMNSTDFVGRHGPFARSKKDDKDLHHHQFIYRQRGFVTTCAEFLKAQGIHWMILIDSDEFLVVNRFNKDDDDNNEYARNTTYQMRHLLSQPELENATALDMIRRIERDIEPLQPCTVLPRLRFGALESKSCPVDTNQLAKTDYNYAAMSTLRYKQHAGKTTFAANKFGKVMVDLSQISNASLSMQVPKNIHRPFKDECPFPVIWFQDALFSINHYTASWERYSHRENDARRTCENWIELAYHDFGSPSCEQGIDRWFLRFVELVGPKRAKYLLGVDKKKRLDAPTSTEKQQCPPPNFDFTRLQRKYGWNMSNLVVVLPRS